MCNKIYNVKEIGQRIDEKLTRKGWTKAKLAFKVGCSRSTISRYIKGETEHPSLDEFVIISKVFDESIDWLLYGDHEGEDERKLIEQLLSDLDELYKETRQLERNDLFILLQFMHMLVERKKSNDQALLNIQKTELFNRYRS
ncbi:MAG: helix-turn-helix domain-containing protein [Cyclobacteriaceae bacterium]